MISESDSTVSTLERIVNKVVLDLELENKSSRPSSKRKSTEIPTPTRTCKVTRLSSNSDPEEPRCRICYDSGQRYPIIYPCRCKGTMGAIHLKCLERWLEESNRNSCELCGHLFQVQRTPRYHALQSIMIWFCLSQREHQLFVRSVRIDLLRCIIVTPVTMGCSYICVVAADFYSMNNYDNFPPARWTTYSLLAMMTLLIFSYFVWMYMAIQYHERVWFYWWQKTSMVKVTLPVNATEVARRPTEVCVHR
ncbi:E3 ubiquitin-protein ligase MARCH3-like [Orussus abietinus]|uniref:E3 ubiquitin-protein ligase MARCH3-like n=1 Tax=Orussus abietinus TaxID=222816 RepID=UPI000C715D00|nr:E3 ubiquitin-protein ligase MARCH3-like [Orussus abietinus]